MTAAQPAPTPNDRPAVWSLVIADMHARDWTGLGRYGVRLQPFNGRDTLRDAYEEALDLAVYLRSELYERDWLIERVHDLELHVASLSERCHKQSELLSQRAEKAHA